ncbi:GGDEF domain-containing protein [Pseudoduganella chitinolytica]|uniref:diguanylate cyclase n=1 Tax=Pseudoduganella chitinolytica TaxID=34070 RepID=A0ABY8BGL8_9BURK|nr:GGDEF domain-containing protein [Pseudoduganella chitinolytica]WEF35045.1 GGDEF domain-containing protein [Pseudoduganella chitinolytica]
MSQSGPGHTGLFVHPDATRYQHFRAACGEAFARLDAASGAGGAIERMARGHVDLLVIDVAGCLPGDPVLVTGLSMLLRTRNGAPVLVLCPYGHTAWLPELMAHGPLQYRIGPVPDAALRGAVDGLLRQPANGPLNAQQQLLDKERELRELLTIQRSVQRAMAHAEDSARLAEQLCAALCSFPGVRHTALLLQRPDGELRLLAEESRNHLDLGGLLGREDNLLASPLRDAFPPLLAASAGELVLLDAPAKMGDPALALALHRRDVQMVLALPLRGEPGGPLLGAISLMFDRSLQFTREQFACFASLAQFIGFALAMSELRGRNDALADRLTQLDTRDPLTGAINRRAGEALLDSEIRRARRYGIALAVIAFDIDNFRSVNDVYGYPIGDQALRAVVATLQGRLRVSDTLARMRGEEFLVIATHTTAADARKLAEKLRGAIAGTPLPGCETVTISLGVAQVAPDEGALTVIERVDTALRRAKRAGRNRVELAD